MKIISLRKILIMTIIICILSVQIVFADNDPLPNLSSDSSVTKTDTTVKDNSIEYIQSVIRMIMERYKGEITTEKLMDGALKGMVETIDASVRKLTDAESASLINMVDSTYEGIGVLIEVVGDYVTVKKVFSGSPAETAGVLPGDKFFQIEGESVVGVFTDDISNKVKGPAGTKVKIIFLRGDNEKVELEVSRGKISINPVTYETKGDIAYLQTAIKMFRDEYNGAITDEKLMEGALKGIFNTMDAYTKYYNVDEANNFFNTLNGTYEGIGIESQKDENFNIVSHVYANSPAEAAGIIPGDKIEKVGDVSVVGATADEFVNKVRGPAGTKIKLGIIRENQKLDIEVTREKIVIAPVTYEIKGDIGYIILNSFGEDSNAYMKKAIAEMDDKKIKKIILDLRDNGGGYVDQAVFIAQNFVPMGLLTKLDYKSEKEKDVEYYSYLGKVRYKLAVLVNGNSASASEILAGAIQDKAAGTLIGTKTFGKAKVQEIVQLLTPQVFKKLSKVLGTNIVDSSSLLSYGIKLKSNEIGGYTKITVGTYTTPKGRMIDLKGLMPDIVVENPKVTNNIDVKNIQKLSLKKDLKCGQEGFDVFNAERILSLAGYAIKTPDFKFDDNTTTELKKFQKENKLALSGQLDLKTQQSLNDQLEKLILATDKQYAKAVEILNEN